MPPKRFTAKLRGLSATRFSFAFAVSALSSFQPFSAKLAAPAWSRLPALCSASLSCGVTHRSLSGFQPSFCASWVWKTSVFWVPPMPLPRITARIASSPRCLAANWLWKLALTVNRASGLVCSPISRRSSGAMSLRRIREVTFLRGLRPAGTRLEAQVSRFSSSMMVADSSVSGRGRPSRSRWRDRAGSWLTR